MKKILFALITLCCTGFGMEVYSQACTPPAQTGTAAIRPTWDSLDCIIRGQVYTEVIEIENFTSVAGIPINYLRIDSIGVHPTDVVNYSGIPAGITYTTDKGDVPVQYNAGETGCVAITGTTNAPRGNYRLGIYVTINAAIVGNVSGEVGELASTFGAPIDSVFFLRVIESGETCPDSTVGPGVGIGQVSDPVAQITIQPNPFNSLTEVSFNSSQSGMQYAKVYDVTGKEVFSKQVNAVTGQNTFRIERGNMSKGIYILTITNGESSISKRLVIRD